MKLKEVKFNVIPRNGSFLAIVPPPDVTKSKMLELSEDTLKSLAKKSQENHPLYIVAVDPDHKEELAKKGIVEGGFVFLYAEQTPYGTRICFNKKKFYLDAFFYPAHSVCSTVPYTEEYEKYYEENLTIIDDKLNGEKKSALSIN